MRETNGEELPPEVRTLIQRSFDEQLSASELQQLQQALKQDPDARAYYAAQARLVSHLSTQAQAAARSRDVLENLPEQPSAEFLSVPPRGTLRDGLARLNASWTGLANRVTAALLFFGVSIGCGVGLLAAALVDSSPNFLPLPWAWGVDDDVIARIATTEDLVWLPSETPVTPPTRGLRVGQQVRIERGLIELRYRSGVGLVLRGPAVFEVRSEHGGKLFSGRLSVVAPVGAKPFHVETNLGRAQITGGHVGIDSRSDSSRSAVTIRALSGAGRGAVAQYTTASGLSQDLLPGEVYHFDEHGTLSSYDPVGADDIPSRIAAHRATPFEGDVIPLGNLFDDSIAASLSEAVQTDTFQAAGETTDLGVAAVQDGGLDVDVRLAEDGPLFNFLNVGGGGSMVLGLPGNDVYRSVSPVPIRTTGVNFADRNYAQKIEEGIGISSNELLTFDLDEIRAAGRLGDRGIRFVVDRAGINDADRSQPRYYRQRAKANLVVIVSSEDHVLTASVNGVEHNVARRGGVYSFDFDGGEAPEGLGYDGRYAQIDLPIPPRARFLTLASTQLLQDVYDHLVLSGARLVLSVPADETVTRAP